MADVEVNFNWSDELILSQKAFLMIFMALSIRNYLITNILLKRATAKVLVTSLLQLMR